MGDGTAGCALVAAGEVVAAGVRLTQLAQPLRIRHIIDARHKTQLTSADDPSISPIFTPREAGNGQHN